MCCWCPWLCCCALEGARRAWPLLALVLAQQMLCLAVSTSTVTHPLGLHHELLDLCSIHAHSPSLEQGAASLLDCSPLLCVLSSAVLCKC